VIEVRGLRKTFQVHERPPGLRAALRSVLRRETREVVAVGGVSFSIADGERVGFLGPNGAGKTTTLKMLAGLLRPSGGELSVDGYTPWKREDAFLSRIMLVMGQKQQLLWDLPASETFELNRAIYGVDPARFRRTMAELTALLEIGDVVNKPVRQLSLGERMKCELVAALVHEPRVLFLDEPTIGLDVAMQIAVREFIRRYNERTGATLLLTSHYMDDVLALCPRVIVIDRGQLSYDGGLDALVHEVKPEKRMILRLGAPPPPGEAEALGRVIESEPGRVVIQVPQDRVREALTRALDRLQVTDLTVEDPPLEDVMRDLFARTRAAGAP
jgi:ABC-2 type transport system ATP-binding protein